MNDNIRTRETNLAPERLGRALDALCQTQRNAGFRNKISEKPNQIHVVIRRVLLSHRRLHKMRVTPGTGGTFGDKTEPDSFRCFRKKRNKGGSIIAGEIKAQIESAA